MVCETSTDERLAECIIEDIILGSTNDSPKESMNAAKDVSISIKVEPTTKVREFLMSVSLRFTYDEKKYQLVFLNGENNVILDDVLQKSMLSIGVNFDNDATNKFCFKRKRHQTKIDEDESDTAQESPSGSLLPPLRMNYISDASSSSSVNRANVGYVGLVNQAMTCYLNSMLQALFMTPEFRNALYKWEFDGKDEVFSIPYQLQKLFVSLQTSSRLAVETTELTRSFGWDSSEAWQQHDIQELCRVMFDALEQKFKNTKQADLINRLYEGKMLDYVKCLECGNENSREDTFLDIPLPVRCVGMDSVYTYGSVKEAMHAFVSPETLDGSNQYHCDKCGKKCDAHKGLKFTKFPYLLTLHLKRFDFDYNTLHRIKLNDRVTFPEILNLNNFIQKEGKEETELGDTTIRCDDSSTTDSGSALDEDSCLGTEVTATSSNYNDDYPDNDEGIDVSDETNHRTNNQENKKNAADVDEPGPYMYELFSIMIHSGSASGGHYYAYIKDFKTDEWFCFNDQSVSRITTEDIHKSYGGGHFRGYYSGAFSSSTNAYMLMYRQIDKERNAESITVDQFPPHIQQLYQKLKEKEEIDRQYREEEIKKTKLRVYAHHPYTDEIIDAKVCVSKDTTLRQVTKQVHSHLNLDDMVPLSQCRLVSYDRLADTIECSFDGREDETLGEILNIGWRRTIKNEFLLEIRGKNDKFVEYQSGSLAVKVYMVDIETEIVEGPVTVRGTPQQTVIEFKKVVAAALEMDDGIKLAVEKFGEGARVLEDYNTLATEGIYTSMKLYAAKAFDLDPMTPFVVSKFNHIVDQFEHVVSLQILLPEVDKETLDALGIPTLEESRKEEQLKKQDVELSPSNDIEVMQAAPEIPTPPALPNSLPNPEPMSHSPQRASPLPVEVGSDQSNSEDSSLSDSDRTLVGDVPDDEGLAQLSVSSMSPCVSSPDEAKKNIHYFKASELITESKQNKQTRMLKILIDKRMILEEVKKELEPYVGVAMHNFKLYRHGYSQESECVRLTEDFTSYTENAKLTIKLGRALRTDECQGKIYQLIPDDPEPIQFLFDWIVSSGATVATLKKGVHAELKRRGILDIPYDRLRLRKKSWKYPGRVYLDQEKFVLSLSTNWEVFVQVLDEPEIVTTDEQVIIFVKKFSPSTWELSGFKEFVLDKNTRQEFFNKLSQMSGIPLEFLRVSETRKNFPNEYSVFVIQNGTAWSKFTDTPPIWDSYEDGCVYLYKDSREQLKELTSDERLKISQQETKRTRDKFRDKTSLASPRRERGLKIYLDSKKDDEPSPVTNKEIETTETA